MKIGMSCTAEGFGHAARTVALSQILGETHDLVYFAPEKLRDFFQENLPGRHFHPIPYFRFVHRGGGVDYLATLWVSLVQALAFFPQVFRLAQRIRQYGLEGMVCDFDPYMSYAARLAGVPIVQINHPGVVLNWPEKGWKAKIARMVTRGLMAHYDQKIICSFYNGDVGPIIRKQIAGLQPVRGEKILVYLKGEYRTAVVEKLERLGISNYELFPDPEKDFNASLASCRAVIATSGHQLMTEALHLGKPLFVIPQKGQYEQELNARMLLLSGRGLHGTIANLEETLPHFLDSLDQFPLNRSQHAIRFVLQNQAPLAARLIVEALQKRLPRPLTKQDLEHREHSA